MAITGNTRKITVEQANTLMQGMAAKNDARFQKQEEGKGLSTNDYDAAAKAKLDGIGGASTSAAGLAQLSSATDSEAEDKAATPKAVKEAYDLANGKQSPQTTLSGYGITDAYTKGEVDSAIAAKLGSVYKPAGSKASAELTSALLVQTNEGSVYNVTDALTTTEDFVEGAGNTHGAGTNVVVVKADSAYKFDVLAGIVDLSGYATTDDVAAASEQDIRDIVDGLYAD